MTEWSVGVVIASAGTRLILNEQIEEEDGSLTVNGAYLTGPDGIDVVFGQHRGTRPRLARASDRTLGATTGCGRRASSS